MKSPEGAPRRAPQLDTKKVLESGNDATATSRLEHVTASLEYVKGADYTELRQAIEGKVSDIEAQDIENAIGHLQMIGSVQGKLDLVKRLASKGTPVLQLHDAHVALKSVEGSGVALSEGAKYIINAIEHLYEACAIFASEDVQKEIAVAGGAYTPAELEEAKKRAAKIQVR